MRHRILLSVSIAVLCVAGLIVLAVLWLRPQGAGPRAGQPALPPPSGAPAAGLPTVGPQAPLDTAAGGQATPQEPVAAAPGPFATRIRGKALDADRGDPLAGARVRVALDAWGVDPRWLEETVTGADGSFDIEALGAAGHSLLASSPGHRDARADGVLPGEEVTLSLALDPGLPCRLEVDAEDGWNALPSHDVSFEDPRTGWSLLGRTDFQGRFVITGIGRDELEASQRSSDLQIFVRGFSEPDLATDESGELVVRVERGLVVRGEVRDAATGAPIAGARVQSDSGDEVVTDRVGTFRIAGVGSVLTAYASGYAHKSLEVEENDDNPLLDVPAVFELESGLTLEGRVLDSKGRPIVGVHVGLALDTLDLDDWSGRLEQSLLESLRSTTDASGSYRIAGLSPEALDLPGDVELELVVPPNPGPWTREVEIPAEEGVVKRDLIIDLVAEASGRVLDAAGSPVGGAVITFKSREDDARATAISAADGSFVVRGAISGSHDVSVTLGGRPIAFTQAELPADSLEITAKGLQPVAAVLLAEGSREPLDGITAELRLRSGEPVARGRSDAAGRLDLGSLPPGDYRLQMRWAGPRIEADWLAPQHIVDLTVGDGPWQGEVAYPTLPWGLVLVYFESANASGARAAFDGPVRVTAYLRAPADASRARRVPLAFGQSVARTPFQARLRPGTYELRCRKVDASRAPDVPLSLEVREGATAEATVFLPP